MTFFYLFFRGLMRVMLGLFFYKIKVEGAQEIPKNTPLLVVPNHQNALLDPLLIGSFIPLELHYLARSDVFTRWTKPFLRRLNMIPIYRIRDGYSKLSLNDDVFAQCKEVFKKDGSVLIFPEGNHGKEYYLRPLTKGASRLAIQSQLVCEKDIMILPVGINYWQHRKPKSTVLIKFGKPISVNDFVKDYEKNEAKGLIKVRDAMSNAMKSTLIIPEQTNDYQERKNFIFHEINESLGFDELKAAVPSENPTVYTLNNSHWLAKVLNPIPFFIIHFVLRKTKDVVFHATLKFSLGMMILFPIWWVATFFLSAMLLGIKIATLIVVVMVTGLFYSYQR